MVLVDPGEGELLKVEAEENIPEDGVILDEGEDVKVLVVEKLALEVVLIGCDVLELEEGPDVVPGGVIELEEDDIVELKVGIGDDEWLPLEAVVEMLNANDEGDELVVPENCVMDVPVFEIDPKELAKLEELDVLASMLEVEINPGVVDENVIELADEPLDIVAIEEVEGTTLVGVDGASDEKLDPGLVEDKSQELELDIGVIENVLEDGVIIETEASWLEDELEVTPGVVENELLDI